MRTAKKDLRIRHLRLEDRTDYLKFGTRGYPVWTPESEVARFLEEGLANSDTWWYALIQPDTNVVFGDIQIAKGGYTADQSVRSELRAEIGFSMLPAKEGRGYMTTALRTVLSFVFAKGIRLISAEVFLTNQASRHVLERLGFMMVEPADPRDLEHYPENGVVYYALSANDWWRWCANQSGKNELL